MKTNQLNGLSNKQFKVLTVREDDSTPISAGQNTPCDTPVKMVDFWRANIETSGWFEPEKECVIVIVLDNKMRVKGWNLVSLGSLTCSIAEPREIFRPVIVGAGKSFVVMHNHPSGDPLPSGADRQLTDKIRHGSEILGLGFIDHVIVGQETNDPTGKGFFSFRSYGAL